MAAVDFLFNLVSDLDLQVVLLLETAPALRAVVLTQGWFVHSGDGMVKALAPAAHQR